MQKKFKYGLKLWSTNSDNHINEAQNLYDEAVYDFIEIYTVPGSVNTIEKWKKLTVPVIIHAPHYAHGFNLSKPEYFETNIKIFEEAKYFADELNAPYIICHPGMDGNIEETARQLNIINKNKNILIENKPYKTMPEWNTKYCVGSTPQEIKYVLNNTTAGFCCDIGHVMGAANSFKIDYIEFIKKFIDLNPTIFHLSDTDVEAEIDKHYNFGKGNLNIAEILSIMPDNATITLETNKTSEENLDDFKDDVKYLNRLINKDTEINSDF